MSRIMLCHKDMTEGQIKRKVYQIMRPVIMSSPDQITDAQLDSEYTKLFDDPLNYDSEGEHKLYKVTIFNNTEV